MKYEVIWNGKIYVFYKYDEALNCAKSLVYEEEVYDIALILSRNKDSVNIQGLRWIIFEMFELVNLTI